MPGSVTVRPAARDDAAVFLDLVDGLADYERLTRPDAAARQRLVEDAFGEQPRFQVLLAEVDNDVIGYAAWFPIYSTFQARPALYLEDLFVRPEGRGKGAGLALLRACAAEAVRLDYARMEWLVLDWNQPSIDFYEALGARRMDGWLRYRLERDALVALTAAPVA